MCTVVVLFRVVPGLPLVVAANRDESFDRETCGPCLLSEAPRLVGGRDLERGGTWMAVRPDGWFSGLTNLRPTSRPLPARRSRGEVVSGLAAAGSADEARALLAALTPGDFNGFNVLFGDARSLTVAYLRPEEPSVRFEVVDSGVHVLPTAELDAPSYPKVARLRGALSVALLEPVGLAAVLSRLISDHAGDLPPGASASTFPPEVLRTLDAACVHLPGYGTRSSTLLFVGEAGVVYYGFAEGPPCVTAFEDYTSLVRGG